MAELGINVAGRAEQSPDALTYLGARWARCVAYPDANLASWIQGCHDRHIRVLLVLASESIGQDPSGWAAAIAGYGARYVDLVDAWQVGNESDHESPSSWTLEPNELTVLLRVARTELGDDAYLVGPGLVSGQPDWAAYVDWRPVDALACHPYAKEPGSAALDWLIGQYAAYRKHLWVTEYHARSIGMTAALRDDGRVQTALAFCYSDSMVQGFGLLEDPAALADFRAATASQAPVTPGARFQLGFADWAAHDPGLLGRPLENERGGIPGYSQQLTDTGILTAALLEDRGWTLLFWQRATSARFLFDDARKHSVQIA